VGGRRVVDVEHEETRLDTRHVHREDSARHDPMVVAGRDDGIPDGKASAASIQISYPGRRVTVREIETLACDRVPRHAEVLRPSTEDSQQPFSTARDFGPAS